MAVEGWAVVVVVVLTQIGATLTTWTAPGLARVSRDTAAERGAGLSECCEVGLAAVGLLSSVVAGYGVQLMGRLRSDCEEFCEAFRDMGSGDEFSPSLSSSFKWISCIAIGCCL